MKEVSAVNFHKLQKDVTVTYGNIPPTHTHTLAFNKEIKKKGSCKINFFAEEKQMLEI